MEGNKGTTQGQGGAGRGRAEGAAEDAKMGGRTVEVRGVMGRGTVQGRGNRASECRLQGSTAEGTKGGRRTREVEGTKGTAEGQGTVYTVHTVPGRGAEGGRGRGEAHRGGSTRDKGSQGSREHEARDKGRWLEEGIWGDRCTEVRGEACGRGVSSHCSPQVPYPAVFPVYPPGPMYSGVLPPAPVLQHPQAVQVAWGAPGGEEEELRRAWVRVREEERRLRERESQVKGGTPGAAEA